MDTTIKNFGWIPPDVRTPDQAAAHEAAVLAMPEFRIIGSAPKVERIILTDVTKTLNGGQDLLTFFQMTGSCVGQGLGQMLRTLNAIEIVVNGERQKPILPFWLLPYGKSRERAGLFGPGEGSLGAPASQAAKEDGFLDAADSDLPQPFEANDGLTWGEQAEMKWSDGRAISQAFLERSRKHLIKTVSRARSAADVRDALINGYPLTCASDAGFEMRPSVQDGVLLNRRVTTWHHQMSIHGWMNHSRFGPLYYILNSWGKKVHGVCPTGAQPGGFWITENDMEYIVRQGETFAFSQFDGFPAQDIERALFRVVGG